MATKKKEFRIYNTKTQGLKAKLGTRIFTLSKDEKARFKGMLEAAKNTMTLVPHSSVGCFILDENTLLDASVSIARLDPKGSQFFVLTTTMEDGSYVTNQFLITKETLGSFIDVLA